MAGSIFTALSLLLSLSLHVIAAPQKHGQPYLVNVDNETAIIGNDLWNATIGRQYGTKLFYKGKDRVGEAVGHYVSYSKLSRLVRQHDNVLSALIICRWRTV